MSDLAALHGHADQSHMRRERREITGHSLAEMTRVLDRDDESYRIYRVWL